MNCSWHSSIPPFLYKSSRVRKWVPVFDCHFVNDRVMFITLKLKYGFVIFFNFEAVIAKYQESIFARNELLSIR